MVRPEAGANDDTEPFIWELGWVQMETWADGKTRGIPSLPGVGTCCWRLQRDVCVSAVVVGVKRLPAQVDQKAHIPQSSRSGSSPPVHLALPPPLILSTLSGPLIFSTLPFSSRPLLIPISALLFMSDRRAVR